MHRIVRRPLITLQRLPICGNCRSDAVAICDWGEASDSHWRIVLRCGECGIWHDLTIDADVANRLADALDDGLTAIERDLEAVERERMAAEIEVFAEALAQDLIDAQDFGPARS